jgi:ELWxxDGT repeat protein
LFFSADISDLVVFGDELFFVALGGLHRSDGTFSGTALFDCELDGFAYRPLRVGESLIFFLRRGTGFEELWRTDGNCSGTIRLRDRLGNLGQQVALGDRMVFVASAIGSGIEPWASDGTVSGTRLLDVAPGIRDSFPFELVRLGDQVVFRAIDVSLGNEIWKRDGTPAGTRRLADVRVGPSSSNSRLYTPVFDRVFLFANDGVVGEEPWVVDPSTDRARLVADTRRGLASAQPLDSIGVGETFFFVDAGFSGTRFEPKL